MSRRVSLGAILMVLALIGVSLGAEAIVSNNCGLNCAFSVLKLFGRTESLNSLADELKLDDDRLRESTFADLKQVFTARHLRVSAFVADTVPEMLDSIPANSVAIVRIKKSGDGYVLAHFALLMRTHADLLYMDPSTHRVQRATKDDILHNTRLIDATGQFLIIQEEVTSEPRCRLLEDSIDMGTLNKGTGVATAVFALRNTGEKKLEIQQVLLPCGCVERMDYDHEVLSGEFGTVQVRFKLSEIPPGISVKRVRILTNDPAHSSIEVPIRMIVNEAPVARAPRSIPSQISYGRVPWKMISGEPEKITLNLPIENAIKPAKVTIEATSDAIACKLIKDRTLTEQRDELRSRELTYELTWRSPLPKGQFDHQLKFRIESEGQDSIIVPVALRGDVTE